MEHMSADIRVPIELDNPAIRRIERLCIKCGKCRDVCKEQIGVLGCYDIDKTKSAICVHCGQCANVCPTGAITENRSIMDVMKAINDPMKKVVVMTSPSVRVGLGEEFGQTPGSFVEKQMVGSLKALGFDYVFDTTFAADLTIMEEASELLDRIKHNRPLPQFTSCCPAWVRFAETYYPELLPNVSTSKSPISMFGPTIKTYFSKQENINMQDIVCVALTPCTAKKAEIKRSEMSDASKHEGTKEQYDVDHVLTTRELAQLMKVANLDLSDVKEGEFDSLMPRGSGAGVIFGNTGGVMEAAIRTAYFAITKQQPPESLLNLEPVRGIEDMKEATLDINGTTISVAVIHTLQAIRKFIATKDITKYHFIEVMCCRGGCIGGGGQPIPSSGLSDEVRLQRIAGLYHADEQDVVRNSHENEAIKKVYDEFYGEPLSALAEQLLHTSYVDRSSDLHEDPSIYHYKEKQEVKSDKQTVYKCTICGYIYEGENFANEDDSYVCPICTVPKAMFEKVENNEIEEVKESKKQWICTICGYVYEGTDFEKEPDSYVCPICTVPKAMFELK